MSRQLAELMGGTLEYVHVDDQSRFEFSLPLIESNSLNPDEPVAATTP